MTARLQRVALLLLCASVELAAARSLAGDEIWVWTTADGSAHYTDDRERVPEEFREVARVAHREGAGTYQRVEGRAPATEARPAGGMPPALIDPEGAIEASWRAEARAIHEQIAALTQQVDGCRGDHVNLSPGDGSRERREEREEAERCAQAKQDLASARADLDALEERARSADVPPGWLRPPD